MIVARSILVVRGHRAMRWMNRRKEAEVERNGIGPAIWVLLLAVICCGGIALGAGLAGVGALRASVWLLILGLVVIAGSVFWRTRHRV
jgi:hypothetical protein